MVQWLSQSPAVFFLALGRSSPHQFGVASLSGNRQSAAQDSAWLQAALQTIGVGAKSAARYGFWVIDPEAQ